tara:strand:+ start:200 stop:937 length:738 start_codon:yes stop_codon:yes gene_type:complete
MKKREIKDRSYRLRNGVKPLSYTINSRHTRRKPLLHFDGQSSRPLRYASNQKSPFQDEQDKSAVLEPVVFEDGMLFVPKENPVLQEFLYYHPANGQIFEEINKEQDAQQEVKTLELEAKAQLEASSMSFEKMESIARVYLNLDTRIAASAEIKRDVLLFARNNPEEFLNTLTDPDLDLFDNIDKILKQNLLKTRNKDKDIYYNLKSKKTKLCSIPFGETPQSILADFFKKENNVEIYEALVNLLK